MRRQPGSALKPFTYAAAIAAQQLDVPAVLTHLARPLAELGPFTRWRLQRDPDFAAVLARHIRQKGYWSC